MQIYYLYVNNTKGYNFFSKKALGYTIFLGKNLKMNANTKPPIGEINSIIIGTILQRSKICATTFLCSS